MRLLVLPGDGIGPEITEATLAVLQAVDRRLAVGFAYEHDRIGFPALEQEGTTFPDRVREKVAHSDGVILGPVSHLDYPPREQGGINPSGEFRVKWDLYANIRPAKSRLGVSRVGVPMDLVIVRQCTEGFYADRNMFMGVGEFMPTPDIALAVRKVTAEAARKIAVVSFELARARRRKVTVVHKQNVMKMSDGLWLREARAVAKAYPDVELDEKIVDATAALLVRDPSKFDVLMCENMFGDILSDEAAMISGSIGLLPSASLGGHGPGLYEPVHGSAPDIADQGIANPIATCLSAAMMLRYSLDAPRGAGAIETAVDQVLSLGHSTRDLGGGCSTHEMGELLISAAG